MSLFKAASTLLDRAKGFVRLELSARAFKAGQLREARELAEEAVRAFRRTGFEWGVGAALGNLGLTYYEAGYLTKAIDCYEESLRITEKINDRRGCVRNLGYLGAAYADLGQYLKAIDCQQRSLRLASGIGDMDGVGAALGNLCVVYYLLGEYDKALECVAESIKVLSESGNRYGEVRALGYQGSIRNAMGDAEGAVESHARALSVAEEIGDHVGASRAMTNLGAAHIARGDAAQAAACFERSLVVKRRVGDRKGEVSALANMALVKLVEDDAGGALAGLRQSLELARAVSDPRLTAMSLTQLGVALLAAGQPQQSEDSLRQAVALWETTRAGLGENDLNKVSIFERQEVTYRALQKTLVSLGKYEEALEASERGRARALLEMLDRRLATPEDARDVVNSPSIERIRQIAAAERATLVEYSIISHDIEALRPGGGLNEIYIWVVLPNGEVYFRSSEVTPYSDRAATDTSEIASAARAALRVPDRDLEVPLVGRAEDAPEGDGILRHIYRLLIKPVEDLLPSEPDARVIFIPHRELSGLPFPALIEDGGTYLVERHTILTAPSIQFLEYTALAARKRPVDAPLGALVVGNPSMPNMPSTDGEPPRTLRPLPFAEKEAVAIAKLLGTEALLGPKATKTSVVGRMAGRRIIHLATHGLLDFIGRGIPGAVVLAQHGDEDGLLTSEEILGLKLSADLVVLSACNTGQGRFTGDGVVGLSRSFIIAGVPSVIVSLWSVADDSTSYLMTEFYKNFVGGLDKAAALRWSMLATLERYPAPRDWAAFTLVGRAD